MIQEHLLIIVCLDSIRTDRGLLLEEKARIESKKDRARAMPAFTGSVPEASPFGSALLLDGGKVVTNLPAPFGNAEVLTDPADVTTHLKDGRYAAVITDPAYLNIVSSIAQVLFFDRPLAEHYERQFREAKKQLSDGDLQLVRKAIIQNEGICDDTDGTRKFMRFQMKLFVQYDKTE